MNKNEILQLSRSAMSTKAHHILNLNASNNKVTYSRFRERDKKDKAYIIQIIDILGGDIHKHTEYYRKIFKTFLDINDIVSNYNKNIKKENPLTIYNNACKYFFKQNDNSYNNDEQKNIIKWYKTYRGMATGKLYQGDLNNEHLVIRTIQHMMQETLYSYLSSDNAKEDWQTAVNSYQQSLTSII
ncbi:MAG TPA: hypothetical protein PLW93_04550 [Candidatus Absconditabacterales bacterium]|nr:hypothetical protein [Candidatus Absconditabacterales bacterium]